MRPEPLWIEVYFVNLFSDLVLFWTGHGVSNSWELLSMVLLGHPLEHFHLCFGSLFDRSLALSLASVSCTYSVLPNSFLMSVVSVLLQLWNFVGFTFCFLSRNLRSSDRRVDMWHVVSGGFGLGQNWVFSHCSAVSDGLGLVDYFLLL